MTVMNATVIHVQCNHMLVCDHATSQEVFVHTNDACRFSVGDQVRIEFSGVMTMSIPPQISATCITPVSSCGCR